MTKLTKIISITTILLVVTLFLIYWYFFSEPTAFPEDEQLIEEMNDLFDRANAEEIQDTIQLDDKHVFVPFISSNDMYGVSYWKWDKRKWRPIRISTDGDPRVWNTDDDVISTYIIWNFHPDDDVQDITFYLIRDRSYHVSAGEHTYIPRIQVEEKVSASDETYGVYEFSDDWGTLASQINALAEQKNPDMHFGFMFQDPKVQFGYQPLNKNGETVFPENSANGAGFSNGHVQTDFVLFIDSLELEE
ncbi:hypothetical protein [Aquisalibacillus elongatus]|uniref:Uncharacterized protein n=1 Tax=Aquisalibacillus elongatus TaxID=485577 RepID=A0A3N5BAA0_9BACI|nr:hypothetical protein [Aquisalibacillus elongatus]RPF54404.1 hypothetical protein EDC24_1602 [Aquisalibacillus elongatus]